VLGGNVLAISAVADFRAQNCQTTNSIPHIKKAQLFHLHEKKRFQKLGAVVLFA
jgi:hypothetical protein